MTYTIKEIYEEDMMPIWQYPPGEPFILPKDTVEDVYIRIDLHLNPELTALQPFKMSAQPLEYVYVSILTGAFYPTIANTNIIPVELA